MPNLFFFDKIEIIGLRETDDVVESFNNGTIDIISPSWMFPETMEKVNASIVEGTGLVLFVLNHNHPYFGTGEQIPDNGSQIVSTNDAVQARYVRKAMNYMINRTLVSEVNFAGMAKPTEIPILYSAYGRTKIEFSPYSIDEARKMMEYAGFNFSAIGEPNEQGEYQQFFFNITILAPTTCPARNFYHRIFGEELKRIGIGVSRYYETDWGTIVPRTFGYGNTSVPIFDEGGYDILPIGYLTDKYSSVLEEFYSGTLFPEITNITFMSYYNETFNHYFEQARMASDKSGFENAIRNIEALLYDDLPSLSIVTSVDGIAIKSEIHNDLENAIEGNFNWTDTYPHEGKPSKSSESTSKVHSPTTPPQNLSSTNENSIFGKIWIISFIPIVIIRKKWATLFHKD